MPNDITKITDQILTFSNKENLGSLSNITSGSVEIFNNFQKFRKLLGECSVSDAASIEGIIEDMKKSSFDSFAGLEYYKNPEKIVCFSTAMIGLSEIFVKQLGGITKKLETYKTSFLPKYDEVLKAIYAEYNPGKINGAELAGNTTGLLMDVGIAFISQQASEFISNNKIKAEDWLESRASSVLSKMNAFFTFMMVASGEFKWACYLMFVDNLITQIEYRINNLLKLKESIRNLVFDINAGNKDDVDILPASLENYKSALQIIEDTLFLNNAITNKVYLQNEFDVVLNNNMINNFDKAKNLLIGQRNILLEDLTDESIVDIEFDTSINQSYIIPSDLTSIDFLRVLDTSVGFTPNLDNILLNLETIPGLYIQKSNKRISFLKNNELNFNYNNIILEVETPIDAEYVRLGKYILKISNQQTLDLDSDLKIDSGFILNQENKVLHTVTLNLVDKEYHNTDFIVPNFGSFIPFNKFVENIDYTTEKRTTSIQLTESSYTLTKDPSKSILNTIVFESPGLVKIKNDWKQDSTWKGVLLFNYNKGGISLLRTESNPPAKKLLLEMSGDIPAFPEKLITNVDEGKTTVFDEFPEPLKTIYKKYEGLDFQTSGSWVDVGGGLSSFLFGKDLLDGPFDKTGNHINAYAKFIQTGADVLKAYCPLKNTIFTFYSLMEQISVIPEKSENIMHKVNKDWILKLNELIADTMRGMSFREEGGTFTTINEIENSSFYHKALPSLLLDYTNLLNITKLAKLNNVFGEAFNKNLEVEDKFRKYDDFNKWLKDSDKLNTLKTKELEMWSILGTSFSSALQSLLTGEPVDKVKPVLDVLETNIDGLIAELSEIHSNAKFINVEEFKNQKLFDTLLKDIGLPYLGEFIKNGQFEKLIQEDSGKWLGKHGDTVACLNTLADKYFSGNERNYLQSVARYVKYVDINEILSIVDLQDLQLNFTLDLNFLNKISLETINNLKSDVKKANIFKNAYNMLEKKAK